MSERLHPDLRPDVDPDVHPDVDTLSAFVEGVLPEHERAQCLAHLSECSRCRELAFLAQDTPLAPIAPVLVPASARRRWFRPLLAAAALVFVTLLGAWLYLHSRTGAPPTGLVARATPAPFSTPDSPTGTPAPVAPKSIPRTQRRSLPERRPRTPSATPVTVPEPEHTAPAPVAVESSSVSPGAPQKDVTPSPKPPEVVVQAETASKEASSGISGTVLDQSGAVIAGATVQLRRLASNAANETAHTDQAGQFKFIGLAPGEYELEISERGFRQTTLRVEVRPQEIAAVKSTLVVGTTSETVEVTAAVSTVNAESAQLSSSRKRAVPSEPRPLPSKLPADTMVTSEKMMLAVDSAGALFFSGNSGKSWKAVKVQWTGKIDRLMAPPELPEAGKAKFQLTTDSDTDWLSRDGRHWYPAPVPH